MARIVPVERLFASSSRLKRGMGSPQNFPWDEWLDGQCREFRYGEDYINMNITRFISAYRKAAESRGMKLETHIDSPTVCIIRAYRPGE